MVEKVKDEWGISSQNGLIPARTYFQTKQPKPAENLSTIILGDIPFHLGPIPVPKNSGQDGLIKMELTTMALVHDKLSFQDVPGSGSETTILDPQRLNQSTLGGRVIKR